MNSNISIASIPCVTKCIARVIDDVFGFLAHPTQICTDTYGAQAIGECVRLTCTPKEALIVQSTFAQTCNVPLRNLSSLILAITIVFGILAIIFYGIRMLTRLPPISIDLGWDDCFITIALVSMIGICILCLFSVAVGLGTDVWTLTFPEIQRNLQMFYGMEIFYVIATGCTRVSIVLFYLRIFGAVRVFRVMLYVILGICVTSLVIFVPLIVFQCRPLSYVWEFWSGEGHGKCLDIYGIAWAHATINIILDLIVLLSPIPQLLKLQLSNRRRVQVSIMFSVGVFATIVCIIRLQSIVKFAHTENFTYDRTGISYWSIIECGTGIICACMPATQQFFRRFAPNLFGSSGEVSNGSTMNGKKHPPAPAYTAPNQTEPAPISYEASQKQHKDQKAQQALSKDDDDEAKVVTKITVTGPKGDGTNEKYVIWEEDGH